MARKTLTLVGMIEDLFSSMGLAADKPTYSEVRNSINKLRPIAEALEDSLPLREANTMIEALESELQSLKADRQTEREDFERQMAATNAEIERLRAEQQQQESDKQRREVSELFGPTAADVEIEALRTEVESLKSQLLKAQLRLEETAMENAAPRELSEPAVRILLQLADDPEHDETEHIATALDMRTAFVRHHLDEMYDAGFVSAADFDEEESREKTSWGINRQGRAYLVDRGAFDKPKSAATKESEQKKNAYADLPKFDHEVLLLMKIDIDGITAKRILDGLTMFPDSKISAAKANLALVSLKEKGMIDVNYEVPGPVEWFVTLDGRKYLDERGLL